MLRTNYLERTIWILLSVFISFFAIGFLNVKWKALLAISGLIFIISVYLILMVFANREMKTRLLVFIVSLSALIFSLGTAYGVIGISGAYTINDPIYVSSVGLSTIVFVPSAIASLTRIRNEQSKDSEMKLIDEG